MAGWLLGRPWREDATAGVEWRAQPVEVVEISHLWMTQTGVFFHAIFAAPKPYSRDPIPRVVRWRGHLYVEDGHHRVVRALLNRQRFMYARVLTLPD